MAKKIQKHGYVRLQFCDLDGHSFSDMSYFEKYLPENAKLVKVTFYHDFGIYEEPDVAEISIEWETKNV